MCGIFGVMFYGKWGGQFTSPMDPSLVHQSFQKQRCFVSSTYQAYMDVSENSGTPKWKVCNGKPH